MVHTASDNQERYGDPRRLFRLWRELTGEDLMANTEKTVKSSRRVKK